MTTAFVLSGGGGSLGAVQVGMRQALAERGDRPDMLVGTSAGALNAAFLPGHGTDRTALGELAQSWAAARRRDVFPVASVSRLLALRGPRNALCSDRGLRRLTTRHLEFERLEDAPIALHVVATNLLSGLTLGRWRLRGQHGDLSGRRPRCGPGLRAADRVRVRIDRAAAGPPRGGAAGTRCAHRAASDQRGRAVQRPGRAERDPAAVPALRTSAFDFTHSGELMRRARTAAGDWLDSGGLVYPHQERFLSTHGHPAPGKPGLRPGPPPVPA